MALLDFNHPDVVQALDEWADALEVQAEQTRLLIEEVRGQFGLPDDGLVSIDKVGVGSIVRAMSGWHLVFAKRYELDGSVTLGLSEWGNQTNQTWYRNAETERWLCQEPF